MIHQAFDRRKFLKASLLGSVAMAMPWRSTPVLAADAPAAAPAEALKATSRVAVTAGEDRADLAFQALKKFSKEISDAIGNKHVIIKPNNVVFNQPLPASDAKNLEGILEFLKSIGKDKNVTIAESSMGGKALQGFENLAYDKVAAKYGAKMADLDDDDFEIVHCIAENDMRPHSCRVAKTLLDQNNYIISAAKFKTHDRVLATLSLKNIVVGSAIKRRGGTKPEGGTWSNNDKSTIHGGNGYRAINYNIFTLASRLHPHLAVIDGYEGMEGEGPIGGTAVNSRVCVVSPDWLAADRVGLELMGIDSKNVGYLNYCAWAGMGEYDLGKIEIVGPALKDYIKPYKLSRSAEQQLGWKQGLNG